MKDFKKASCVACGEPFDEQSDVVVCPECGAPHHRECWKETGHCACAEKHSEGYEWQPEKMYIGDVTLIPGSRAEEAAPKSEEMTVCPNCGKRTKKSEKYCEYCGYYLFEDEDSFSKKDLKTELENFFPFDQAENIDGVPAGDVKRFVGNMWIYYIPRFIKMSRSKSPVSFNFTAFFTHGFWFISRKMYLPGLLMIFSVTCTSLFQAYVAGMAENLSGNRLALFSILSFLTSIFEFVIMLMSGLFGNRIYMYYCARKIKKINAIATAEKADADRFNSELEAQGGVSMLPALSMGLCYLAILYISERGILF